MSAPVGLDLEQMLADADAVTRDSCCEDAFTLATHVRTLVAAVSTYRQALEGLTNRESRHRELHVYATEALRQADAAVAAVVAQQKG